jgi:hypothetical protein
VIRRARTFNLANSLTRVGRLAEALDALRRSLAKGFRQLDYLHRDPELAPLRMQPGFCEMLRGYEGRG